jgi:hypothetical protein
VLRRSGVPFCLHHHWHIMSTSRSKRIPCHPQCTRCKGVLVSRSTKTRHTKDIQDRQHASTSSLEPKLGPKAIIPTFADWNSSSQRSTRENHEDSEDSLDGNDSDGSRAVKRARRTNTLDPGPVCHFNSQFDVHYCVYVLI